MSKLYLRYFIQTIILLFLQLVVMNNIRLFGLFIPVVYLYPLVFLPYLSPRWLTIALAGLTGLVMDMLMNTPGINMAGATLVGFLRQPILFAFTEEQELDDFNSPISPSRYTMRFGKYLLYMLVLASIHITSVMLLEAFSSKLFLLVLPNIFGSILITMVVYVTFESLSKRNHSV